MDDPRNKHGKFSWNELLTTDPEGAKEFYGQLFGWTTQDWPMDGFNYTIVKAGDTDVGGIMPIPRACHRDAAQLGCLCDGGRCGCNRRTGGEIRRENLYPAYRDPNGRSVHGAPRSTGRDALGDHLRKKIIAAFQ